MRKVDSHGAPTSTSPFSANAHDPGVRSERVRPQFAPSDRRWQDLRTCHHSLMPTAEVSRCSKLRVLLNHLVGALLEMQRHVEAERLRGLEVDRQLELDWKLDGKLARLRAIQDFIHICRRAPKIIAL